MLQNTPGTGNCKAGHGYWALTESSKHGNTSLKLNGLLLVYKEPTDFLLCRVCAIVLNLFISVPSLSIDSPGFSR